MGALTWGMTTVPWAPFRIESSPTFTFQIQLRNICIIDGRDQLAQFIKT